MCVGVWARSKENARKCRASYFFVRQSHINHCVRTCLASRFRLALIQLLVGADKANNLTRAVKYIRLREAASNGAQLIVLPECFNSPYGTQFFPQYCEPIPGGESTRCLSEVARETKTYVVGGIVCAS